MAFMTARSFLMFLFIISNHDVFSQTQIDSTTLQLDSTSVTSSPHKKINALSKYNFFKSLGQNFSEQAKAPFTMTKDQTIFFGAGIAITGMLIYFDQDIDNVISPLSKKNPIIRQSSPQISEIGGTYGIIATGVFGLYGIVLNDKKAQQTSLLLTEALITSGVWVRVGKIFFSRERPSASYEFSHRPGGKWHGANGFFAQSFESVAQNDAFPSGHTATAFAMAAVIADEYGEYTLVPPIAYTIVSAVAVTRMIEHTHWASDVFVGGVIGYLCGKQVVHHYHKHYSSNEIDTDISIGAIGEVPALTLTMKF
jgi:hypothetical protein